MTEVKPEGKKSTSKLHKYVHNSTVKKEAFAGAEEALNNCIFDSESNRLGMGYSKNIENLAIYVGKKYTANMKNLVLQGRLKKVKKPEYPSDFSDLTDLQIWKGQVLAYVIE